MALARWVEGPSGHGEAILSIDLIHGQSVLAPDLLWFAEPISLGGKGDLLQDPGLVIEVRSPSTWHYDLGRKREIYLEHGVPEVWLVNTVDRLVIVHRGEDSFEVGAGELVTSPQIPGFRAIVGDLIPAL